MKECIGCDDCMYIGDGDSICDKTYKLVLDDWEPTDNYGNCNEEE